MSERWQHLRQTLRTPVLFSSSYWGPGLTSHAGPCPALPLALTCGWSLGGAAGGQQAQILLPLPGLHSQPYPFQEASAPSSCGHHVSWGQLPNFSSWGGLDLLDGRSCLDLSRTCAPPPQCASPSVCRTDAHTYLAGLLQGPRQRWLSLTEVFMSGSFVPLSLNQPPLQPPQGGGGELRQASLLLAQASAGALSMAGSRQGPASGTPRTCQNPPGPLACATTTTLSSLDRAK